MTPLIAVSGKRASEDRRGEECDMAGLEPKFHQETLSVHQEHAHILAQLNRLDEALDQMICYSEIYADLGDSEPGGEQKGDVDETIGSPKPTMLTLRRRCWRRLPGRSRDRIIGARNEAPT